ncbi:hypothetical protein NDU88_006134 [Pleurodeles waltl]|uniref:Uncharacterized protein n=1 Tax=Pleurodeles waltl TaxID=8319 RepID=A0AAV7NSE0_PLEWA|nr:hypothetical protein NDU88_006134 [Pleurodeles waltl]
MLCVRLVPHHVSHVCGLHHQITPMMAVGPSHQDYARSRLESLSVGDFGVTRERADRGAHPLCHAMRSHALAARGVPVMLLVQEVLDSGGVVQLHCKEPDCNVKACACTGEG